MFSKFKQLNLFGAKTEDFGSKKECQKEQNPSRGDSRPRDPPEAETICQGKKIDLTEVQKQRARALHEKSKALVFKAYQNNPQIKSEQSSKTIENGTEYI